MFVLASLVFCYHFVFQVNVFYLKQHKNNDSKTTVFKKSNALYNTVCDW